MTDAWRVKSGRITVLPAGENYLTAVNPDDRNIKGETTFRIGVGEEITVTVDMKRP